MTARARWLICRLEGNTLRSPSPPVHRPRRHGQGHSAGRRPATAGKARHPQRTGRYRRQQPARHRHAVPQGRSIRRAAGGSACSIPAHARFTPPWTSQPAKGFQPPGDYERSPMIDWRPALSPRPRSAQRCTDAPGRPASPSSRRTLNSPMSPPLQSWWAAQSASPSWSSDLGIEYALLVSTTRRAAHDTSHAGTSEGNPMPAVCRSWTGSRASAHSRHAASGRSVTQHQLPTGACV